MEVSEFVRLWQQSVVTSMTKAVRDVTLEIVSYVKELRSFTGGRYVLYNPGGVHANWIAYSCEQVDSELLKPAVWDDAKLNEAELKSMFPGIYKTIGVPMETGTRLFVPSGDFELERTVPGYKKPLKLHVFFYPLAGGMKIEPAVNVTILVPKPSNKKTFPFLLDKSIAKRMGVKALGAMGDLLRHPKMLPTIYDNYQPVGKDYAFYINEKSKDFLDHAEVYFSLKGSESIFASRLESVLLKIPDRYKVI